MKKSCPAFHNHQPPQNETSLKAIDYGEGASLQNEQGSTLKILKSQKIRAKKPTALVLNFGKILFDKAEN